jgi:hypothetical protein
MTPVSAEIAFPASRNLETVIGRRPQAAALTP